MAKRTAEQLLNEIAKPQSIALLGAMIDAKMLQLKGDYPERESATWAFQLEQSKQYQSDNSTPVPFLSAAIKPGETVAEYAALIIANNTQWSTIAGEIVLLRRTLQDAIEAASTEQELALVDDQIRGYLL